MTITIYSQMYINTSWHVGFISRTISYTEGVLGRYHHRLLARKNEQCTFMIVRVAGFVFLACVGWNSIQCFYLIPTEAQILRGCLTLKAPWVWVVKSACLLSPLWALNPHSLQLLTYVSLLLFEVFFYSAFYHYFLTVEERHTATDNRNHWITAQGRPS